MGQVSFGYEMEMNALRLRTHKKIRSCALGHNRMPSRGSVCLRNTHPFKDCKGDFALIHNGTISSGMLRRLLLAKGTHKFEGETDSELIAHIIEEMLVLSTTREEALQKTNKIIDGFGNWGVLCLFRDGKVYGIRHNEPIKIVQKNNEVYILSDISALEKVGFDKDEEVLVLEPKEDIVFKMEQGKLFGKFEVERKKIVSISKQDFGDLELDKIYKQRNKPKYRETSSWRKNNLSSKWRWW